MNETIHMEDAAAIEPPTKPTETRICEQHGEYDSKVTTWPFAKGRRSYSECPACSEAKQLEAERQRQLEEARRKQAALTQRLTRSGIPPRFIDGRAFVCESEGQKDVFKFAKAYVDDFDEVYKTGRSAVFLGSVGTGKTHLACDIALKVIEKGATARYTTLSGMFNRVKDTWNKERNESQAQAMAAFTSPDLLIIDEVGIAFGSDTEQKILFDIMDERYLYRLPTILVSNLGQAQFKDAVGARLYDRLREDGGRVVPFNWPSFRGRKKLGAQEGVAADAVSTEIVRLAA